LATGNIAAKFARDLALVPDQVLAAVASRRHAAAEAFALEHTSGQDSRPTAHGSYAGLLADPEVDVVYVATPHARHAEDVLACLDAGKAVLCEKPLTLDAEVARHLVAEARRRGLFLAEAMWMRTNPAIRAVHAMVRSGRCGALGTLRADLGFVGPRDRERLWDPSLGASALLDVGVYPVTFAHLMLGPPVDIAASGALSDRGIDIAGGATLTHASGAISSLSWSQVAWSDSRASVAGDAGRIEIPGQFHHPDGFTFTPGAVAERPEETVEPRSGSGLFHEIVEVGACLRAGRTESEILPLDGTIEVMRTLDAIRERLGVRY